MMGRESAAAQQYAKATRGLPPLKITGVKVILTNPPVTQSGQISFMRPKLLPLTPCPASVVMFPSGSILRMAPLP